MDIVTLYLCVIFHAVAVIVGVVPPPVSRINTCWAVTCGSRRIMGCKILLGLYCNSPYSWCCLLDDWRRQDICDGNGCFK
jgi:hypothetical protein